MTSVGSRLLPVPDFTPQHVHDLTKRILAEPQFRQAPKPWLQRLDDWLGRELDRLFNAFVTGGATTAIAWLIAAAAVVTAAILLRRFGRRLQRDPGVQVHTTPRRRWTSADWRAQAAEHRKSGEWREAIRCSYRALIAALAERGVVEEVPGRTTREYEELVKRHLPGGVPDFGSATELFEAIWYGHYDGTDSDDDRMRELGDRVLAVASRN